MNKQFQSQDQLNDQINEKLGELWKTMKNKKKNLLNTLTPNYSRKTENTYSKVNSSITNQICNKNNTKYINENSQSSQVIRQKDIETNQTKQIEMENMRNTILQLQNQKAYLFSQLQSFNANISENYDSLNQSSIMPIHKQHNNINTSLAVNNLDGRTAFFSNNKKKDIQKSIFKKSLECVQQNQDKQNNINYTNQTKTLQQSLHKVSKSSSKNNQSIQNLSRRRLIQLLKSTSQYRQFAYFYDSHQLSYLKRLQEQHKKNCSHNISEHEKKYWAPTQILNQLKQLNKRQNMNLNENNIQSIVGHIKQYFQINQKLKISKITQKFQNKIKKLQRQKQNEIPYDLVRISNARQRMSNLSCKKKYIKTGSSNLK